MGHVGEAFGKGDLIQRLPGYAAIGHTRYATAGGYAIRNVQPMFADLDGGRHRHRPQRQPDQLPDPAPPAGRRGRDLPVDLATAR